MKSYLTQVSWLLPWLTDCLSEAVTALAFSSGLLTLM